MRHLRGLHLAIARVFALSVSVSWRVTSAFRVCYACACAQLYLVMPCGGTDLFTWTRREEKLFSAALANGHYYEQMRQVFDGGDDDRQSTPPRRSVGDENAPVPRRPSLADSRAIVAQLARALTHCHAAGIAHRDVKPENIILNVAPSSNVNDSTRLHVRLVDFGSACRLYEAAPVSVARVRLGTRNGTLPHTERTGRATGRDVPAASAAHDTAAAPPSVLLNLDCVGSPGFLAPEVCISNATVCEKCRAVMSFVTGPEPTV